MPTELKKTSIRRAAKAKKAGKANKTKRENQGTTPLFPLEGPIMPTRFGFAVDAESIIVPQELLTGKAPKAATAKKPAAKPAATK
jgi:hypothetical protein